VSEGEHAATNFPSGDQLTDVAGPCNPSNLTTQDEEGLETTLAGSIVQRSTPALHPTASWEADNGCQARQVTPFMPANLSSGWVALSSLVTTRTVSSL